MSPNFEYKYLAKPATVAVSIPPPVPSLIILPMLLVERVQLPSAPRLSPLSNSRG